ncbi:MAG: hypothetical protein Q7R92_05305 [bacterium]|nr:hypothetical protein [bacterium]
MSSYQIDTDKNRLMSYHRRLFEKVDDLCKEIGRQFDDYLKWRVSREGKFILMLNDQEFPWEDVPYVFYRWHERPVPHIVFDPSESPEKQKSAGFFLREDIEAAEEFIEAVSHQKMERPYEVKRWLERRKVKT